MTRELSLESTSLWMPLTSMLSAIPERIPIDIVWREIAGESTMVDSTGNIYTS